MPGNDQPRYLRLNTTRDLALRLSVAEEELCYVARTHAEHYTSRVKIVNGKRRKLYTPRLRLATILKRLDHLLQSLPLPDNMHGSRRGHRARDAARPHVRRPQLGKIDIKSFFPTVQPDRVQQLFISLGCSPQVAGLLCRLSTADDHLPQGFNSSSSIANLILSPSIARLKGLADAHGLSLTNYLDDIAISGGDRVSGVHRTGLRIIDSSRLMVNRKKSRVFNRSESQTVVGFTLNHHLSVSREYRQRLAKVLHKCAKYGPESQCDGRPLTEFRNSLIGQINHVRNVRPLQARSLQHLFSCIHWPDC